MLLDYMPIFIDKLGLHQAHITSFQCTTGSGGTLGPTSLALILPAKAPPSPHSDDRSQLVLETKLHTPRKCHRCFVPHFSSQMWSRRKTNSPKHSEEVFALPHTKVRNLCALIIR